jgi:hypothetical protein
VFWWWRCRRRDPNGTRVVNNHHHHCFFGGANSLYPGVRDRVVVCAVAAVPSQPQRLYDIIYWEEKKTVSFWCFVADQQDTKPKQKVARGMRALVVRNYENPTNMATPTPPSEQSDDDIMDTCTIARDANPPPGDDRRERTNSHTYRSEWHHSRKGFL